MAPRRAMALDPRDATAKLDWDEVQATKQLAKAGAMFEKREPDVTVLLAFKKACAARDGLEYSWIKEDALEATFDSFLTTSQNYLHAKQKRRSEKQAVAQD